MIDATELPKAPATVKDTEPGGAANAPPRIILEGGVATRVARLVQMHKVAAQLDAGDADAVRETVERQVGKLIVEAVRG